MLWVFVLWHRSVVGGGQCVDVMWPSEPWKFKVKTLNLTVCFLDSEGTMVTPTVLNKIFLIWTYFILLHNLL